MYNKTTPSFINIIAHICINGCLCSFVFTSLSTQINLPLLLLLLPSTHVFQLICSILTQHSDLNHLIGVSIWVPNRPRGPPAWLCNGWLCIDNTMQPKQSGRTNPQPTHPSNVLSRLTMLSFTSCVSTFSCHSCYLLFMHVSPCLLLLVLSASSIIVLQRHAQAGWGVQWRRAPGDPRSAFQLTGCQVKTIKSNLRVNAASCTTIAS